ncbi:MAG: hypothetical protein ACREXT_14320, partial [Gammaproteobacteria bacterium]
DEYFTFSGLRDDTISTMGLYDVVPPTASFARVYELATPYGIEDIFALVFAQKAGVMTITHPGYATKELVYAVTVAPFVPFILRDAAFAPTIATPGTPTVVAGGPGGGSPVTHFYRVTALAADTQEESLTSPTASASRDLTIAGNFISITPATVTGAIRYNVYKLRNGLYGFIAQTEGAEVRDDNIAPDMSKTIPYPSSPFGTSGNHPSVCYYFQGRRGFAATDNFPQNYWLTVSGTEGNLSYTIPSRADDSIASALGANQVHRIHHAVQLTDLLFLTSAGEWKLGAGVDVLTPANAFAKQDAAEGSTTLLRPVVASGTVVYGAASQRRLNKIQYSWQQNAYVVEDLSILAPHLFDDFLLTDLCTTKSPHRFIWSVRSDGTMLCLTYHPEHEVTAWHRHTTDGKFKSCTHARLGSDEELWVVVEREIAGTWNYVERMPPRRFAEIGALSGETN